MKSRDPEVEYSAVTVDGGVESREPSKQVDRRVLASRLRFPHADTRIGLKTKDTGNKW